MIRATIKTIIRYLVEHGSDINKENQDKETPLFIVCKNGNKELAKYDKDVIELADYNKDIKFGEKELKLFDEYANNNIQCTAAEKYYNDNVVIFNKLVKFYETKRYRR